MIQIHIIYTIIYSTIQYKYTYVYIEHIIPIGITSGSPSYYASTGDLYMHICILHIYYT